MTTEAFFQNPVISQQRLNIATNSSYKPYIYNMIAASILKYVFIIHM